MVEAPIMVEVYSTDVKSKQEEQFILKILENEFPRYKINFDLEDCDNILRVEIRNGSIDVEHIITVMKDCGFTAEVLPDEPNIHTNTEIYGQKTTDVYEQTKPCTDPTLRIGT